MGQPSSSIFQAIGQFLQWSEQRTAVSELRQGNLTGLPSRTPASTVLNVLNEGNKRFDMILSNLREGALKDVGKMVLQNLIQITKDDKRWVAEAIEVLGEQDGIRVAQILDGNLSSLERNFGVSVTATSSKVNKEVQKQNLIFLAQMMGQMYPQQIQYAQALGDQQLMAQTVVAAYTGLVELQKRILEAHDIQNVDAYIPTVAPGTTGPSLGQPGPAQAAPLGLGGTAGPGPFAQGPNQIGALLGLQ